MDDLFALVEEDDNQQALGGDDVSQTSEPRRGDSSSPAPPKNIHERLSSSIDAQIGLRIINRKISGAEMMDMIAASVYRSPAILSAMSLEDLNNHILAEPTLVVNAATVCGRTNFCTAGMVFSNSGTRISSTGNAFCALTLGNFASGPAISVLLFGTAYSKYVRALTPGKVVFLENPRLAPSKSNSSDRKDTSISFSASNEREIQLVGDAQDFGICKAMVRGKNENGQWTDNAKRCKTYVDTRECLYCKVHRQQNNVVDKSSGNKLDKLRQEVRENLSQSKLLGHRPGDHLQRPTNPAQSMLRSAAQPSVGSSVRAYQPYETRQQSTNPLLNDCVAKPAVRHGAGPAAISRNLHQSSTKVTPTTSQLPCRGIVSKKRPSVPTTSKPNFLSQISGGRSNGNKRKLGSVNTDTDHFDGQVAVPKSKQFVPIDRERASAYQAKHQRPVLEVGSKSETDIRMRQRQLAEQRKGDIKNLPLRPTPQNRLLSQKNGPEAIQKAKGSDIFGSVSKDEMARVMAAKSRFADEADAEEYARARQAVSELEKEELKALRKDKNKQNKTNQRQSSIKTEYFCVQCKRNYVKVPRSCHLMEHKIRIDRKILGTQTTAEKRMMLSTKSVEDGGMVLAQGIDWDSRFSYRS
ncbi:minichromosome maintenance protein 10 [Fistulifera solaris]|uniref:Minichromosome maintenance protein 10 n=1 Tax=Fistulifera solaris TaxID=1519565 RepID=A0A1Z5K178_FISSO|nr:minichromosome maintenance protein 10 [Fistulifera solaris]|eukprot:GAX20045.1 minichromosome maintenance protein 10 [Fistulifera solaris]